MKKANISACLLFLAYALLLHWPRPLQVTIRVAAGDVPELDVATVDFEEQLNRYGLRHAPTRNNLAAGLFETLVPGDWRFDYATPAELKALYPKGHAPIPPNKAKEATAKAFGIKLPSGLQRLLDLPHYDGIYGFMYDGPWTEDQVPVFAQWLDDHQELLDEIQQLCERDYYFQFYHGLGYNTPLPLVQVARDIAQALLLRSNRALGEARRPAAAQDILSILRLGTLFGQGYSDVELSVGASIHEQGCLAAAHYVSQPGLTLEEIVVFQQRLAKIPAPRIPIHAIDIAERFVVLTALQAAQRDGYSGYARATAGGFFNAATGTYATKGSGLFSVATGIPVPTGVGDLDRAFWNVVAAMVDWNEVIQRLDSRFDKVVEILTIKDRKERAAALAELDRQLELFFQERTLFSFTDTMEQHIAAALLPAWTNLSAAVDRTRMA